MLHHSGLPASKGTEHYPCYSLPVLTLTNSLLKDTLKSKCLAYLDHNRPAPPGAKQAYLDVFFLTVFQNGVACRLSFVFSCKNFESPGSTEVVLIQTPGEQSRVCWVCDGVLAK